MRQWPGLSRQPQRLFHFPGRPERAPEHVLSAQSAALRSSCFRVALCQSELSDGGIPPSYSSVYASAIEKFRLRLRAAGESHRRTRNRRLLEIQSRLSVDSRIALEPPAGCQFHGSPSARAERV